jgi:hypothetical protein
VAPDFAEPIARPRVDIADKPTSKERARPRCLLLTAGTNTRLVNPAEAYRSGWISALVQRVASVGRRIQLLKGLDRRLRDRLRTLITRAPLGSQIGLAGALLVVFRPTPLILHPCELSGETGDRLLWP